jgi:uncharacterized protein (DUF1800 family)
MLNQNNLFRQMALANFGDFLLAVSKDPAMIIWLDNDTNKKGQPNENYARELMELFSMGVDTYTQNDVEESARAFTGWTISKRTDQFFFDSSQHDYGAKTFLGQTGPFNGDDIVSIITPQPATSRFITKKLFEFFVYPAPSDNTINKLAQVYLSSNYSIKTVMQEILNSDEFYSEKAINALVKSPTEFVIGTARMLQAQLGKSYGKDLVQAMALQGQVLFNPPSVAGWAGGLDWINTSTLLNRYNAANALTSNRGNGRVSSIDAKMLIGSAKIKTGAQVVDYFLKLLGLYDVDESAKNALKKYLKQNDDGSSGAFQLNDASIDKKVLGLIHLILSLPDYQLN